MLTTFDGYLLRRYGHVFGITVGAMFGLHVVIDAFSNAGDIVDGNPSVGQFLREVGEIYFFRMFWFFDIIGGTGAVLAALVSLSLVLRYGELNPILSAGVPTYRLAIPMLVGTVLVNLALIANQELIIPRVKHHFTTATGDDPRLGNEVEPDYDRETLIHVSGEKIYLREKTLVNAEFILPVGVVTRHAVTLTAPEAVYSEASDNRPAGWLLRHPSHSLTQLDLLAAGSRIIMPAKSTGPNSETTADLLIVSSLTPDRLGCRNLNTDFLSTAELVHRLKSPAQPTGFGTSQRFSLHTRLLRYVVNMLVVLACVPVLVRKDSRSLLINLALCAGVMGTVFGLIEAGRFLAMAAVLAPDLAAWIPIIVLGTFSAWATGWIRT